MHRYIDEELGAYEKAQDELKRVDHLIYVSLKYTRTVDVIKNIIQRMIACFDCVIDGLLKHAEKEGRLFEIPTAPGARIVEVKRLYNDPALHDLVNFYAYLRKLHNAEYDASKEFRRNVTMTAKLQDGTVEEITIDVITEYYDKCKKLIEGIKLLFSATH